MEGGGYRAFPEGSGTGGRPGIRGKPDEGNERDEGVRERGHGGAYTCGTSFLQRGSFEPSDKQEKRPPPVRILLSQPCHEGLPRKKPPSTHHPPPFPAVRGK